ncbi:hypothetical protein [Paraburkholderia fungorum]|uniref:hypothetical protein n=1 Tax=Paraburkholderia fungorum TaxID=134537 RepID=UPI000DB58582|nr:hypothetical protein [Paraburkholderia fungorum]PZR39631.1 MAG: hypothetical protein DI523_36340 [Paraburkholderia fungorum]
MIKEVLGGAGVGQQTITISGRIVRIGAVPASDATQGYWAILLERRRQPYRITVSSPELAESLALTSPGDEIRVRLKGRFDDVEAGQQCPLLELVNETLANALRFPAMGELPVPMKHSAFD